MKSIDHMRYVAAQLIQLKAVLNTARCPLLTLRLGALVQDIEKEIVREQKTRRD